MNIILGPRDEIVMELIFIGETKDPYKIFLFAPCINDKHFIIQLMHNV